jgi:hypothetical protein
VWIYLYYGQGQEAIRQQDLLIQQQDRSNCLRACELWESYNQGWLQPCLLKCGESTPW